VWEVGKATCKSKAKWHKELVVGTGVFDKGCGGVRMWWQSRSELRYVPATSMAKSNEINPEESEGKNEWTGSRKEIN
jgi:hypothetical protein